MAKKNTTNEEISTKNLLIKAMKLTNEAMETLYEVIVNRVRELQDDFLDVQGKGAEAFVFNHDDVTQIYVYNICGLRVHDDRLQFVGALSDKIYYDDDSFKKVNEAEENEEYESSWNDIRQDDVYFYITMTSIGCALLSYD